jgi:hypothetical protein
MQKKRLQNIVSRIPDGKAVRLERARRECAGSPSLDVFDTGMAAQTRPVGRHVFSRRRRLLYARRESHK